MLRSKQPVDGPQKNSMVIVPVHYLVFEGADVILETGHILLQLVNLGLLVVDGPAELVDQNLKKEKHRCFSI